MSEPVSAGFISVTAGGITVLGIITGLHPALMLAGAAGGWWAMSYQQQMTVLGRLNRILLSSIVAAWASPVAAAWGVPVIEKILPDAVHIQRSAVELGVALIIGLVTIDVLGRSLMSLIRGRMEGTK